MMQADKLRVYCQRCGRETNHQIHYTKELIYSIEDSWFVGVGHEVAVRVENLEVEVEGKKIKIEPEAEKTVFQLAECCGCNWVTLIRTSGIIDKDSCEWVFVRQWKEHGTCLHTSPNPEPDDDEDYFVKPHVTLYPEQEDSAPKKLTVTLTFADKHGSEIADRLDEIYRIKTRSIRASVILLRSLIEYIFWLAEGKFSKRRDISKHLEYCRDEGFIKQNQFELLVLIKQYGNESVHRDTLPTKRQLGLMIEAVESLIWHLFLTDSFHKDIKK
jgi:hypothetical protein